MTENELKKLLEDMTLTEKTEQLVQLNGDFYGSSEELTGPAAAFHLTKEQTYRVGSILSEHGAAHLKEMQDKIMSAQPHHIPAMFMADVIHGYKTSFPVPIALGASFDPELVRKTAEISAKEAAAAGIHVTFSPMSDLSRDGRWGRCMESFGEDPFLNSKMSAAMVNGFQGDNCGEKGKVASCFKHFAAYGAVQSGRDYNVAELSERTLFEDYLPAYKAAVDAGAEMAMTAFNTLDRVPCTVSKKLLRDILRGKMGFEGVIISDYNAIGEAVIHSAADDSRDAAKKAINAGVDIDMMSECYVNNLEDLINSGEVSEKVLDEAVMRVLRLKNKLGLFEDPYKDASEDDEKRIIGCDEHMAFSRRSAAECAVMLKNNGIFPLRAKKALVIGKLCESGEILGFWSFFADKSKTVTLRDALTQVCAETEFEFIPSDTADEKVLAAAKNADAVLLVLGEDQTFTGEARSCTDVSLDDAQKKLFDDVISVNPNTAVLLFGGRPFAIPEIAEKAAGILEMWLPGTAGCLGIADIISGKISPCGRLSMSFPYCTGQYPISYSAFNTGRPKDNSVKGYIPFLSNYMDAPNIPLYPFGYGLTYTSFEYSPVTLSATELTMNGSITAGVTVTNTGDRQGCETVQLYIRDLKGSVVRPLRELKGFKKITLEAGRSANVSFEITADMLRFYGIDMEFAAEKGGFVLCIGGDSSTENSAEFKLI